MNDIVDKLNVYKYHKNNLILITINQYILIITIKMIFILPTPYDL